MTVTWDYSARAATYDMRADYAPDAVETLVTQMRDLSQRHVAEVGAGTGKLTKMLTSRSLTVDAVEPNDEMRRIGIANTSGTSVEWLKATAEDTGLASNAYGLCAFGSSFNVTDRAAALAEAARLLVKGGVFACMWNHRDLSDPIQSAVEETIKKLIPGYSYGSRRKDQTEIISKSGLFDQITRTEHGLLWHTTKEDYMHAWRSHATLARQAGDAFDSVLMAIESTLPKHDTLHVPYVTRMWHARKI